MILELIFVYISAFFQPTDKNWKEKAEKELAECEESRAVKLRLLEERIVEDKDIPNARRDDAFLLRFLRAKKFNVDKSFRMVMTFARSLFVLGTFFDFNSIRFCFFQIQKYFKMKNESPDLFRISPLSDMQNLLKMQMQQILPQHDENGSLIYLFRVREY